MSPLSKQFDPSTAESRWYALWEREGWFAPSHDRDGEPYCIMIPPPNVTGRLHMGHAFQNTVIDILIRKARMEGRPTLWQVGTDHAGIATQMVVERRLARQQRDRKTMGRAAFLDAVWQWKDHAGSMITQQLRRLGVSVDWGTERFTMDAGLSEAVRGVFVQLHREGLIERGKRLVNWDPVLQTAVSDLETVHREVQGSLWTLVYRTVDAPHRVVPVATTRPETLFGDAAIAVHPDDARYADLVGRHVRIPLCDRTIPVVADQDVDPEFGTGCVKVTPAHDFNDHAMGMRHRLPLHQILHPDGTLNDTVPEPFRGLSVRDARVAVVRALSEQGSLRSQQAHTLQVPHGDRTQAVLEPYLTDQWFMRVKPLAQRAIQAVEQGAIRFVPSGWSNTFFAWMHQIEDWCISRQLWWGHRIPAWYNAEGQMWVGMDEASVRHEHGLPDDMPLRQDEDVLDTWFSSALWPFSSLGWPHDTERLRVFYPTSVLVTGFDIIFFWVARMIMLGLHMTDSVPFRDVYIHGLVRDAEGQKMSKSKGNVLDPLDLIDGVDRESLVEKRTADLMQPQMAEAIAHRTRQQFPEGIAAYGTDALRFAFASLAATGRDINFDLGRLEGCRHFVNKIWQAGRFVDQQLHELPTRDPWQSSGCDLAMMVSWNTLVRQQHEHLKAYRFDLAAQSLYDFWWSEYCDWYVEYTKACVHDPKRDPEAQRATLSVLWHVFEGCVRLLHPFLPFVTETIWQHFRERWPSWASATSVMCAAYPQVRQLPPGARGAVQAEAKLRACVGVLRTLRSQSGVKPSDKVSVFGVGSPDDVQAMRALWEEHAPVLTAMTRAQAWLTPDTMPRGAYQAPWGNMILGVRAADFDPVLEQKRLSARHAQLTQALQQVQARLDNPQFVVRAPDKVVADVRSKHAALSDELAAVQHRLDDLR